MRVKVSEYGLLRVESDPQELEKEFKKVFRNARIQGAMDALDLLEAYLFEGAIDELLEDEILDRVKSLKQKIESGF